MQDSNNHREREIFTKHRAIDRLSGRPYSRRWGKGGFKFLSPGCCAKFKHSGGPSLALHFTGVRRDEEDGTKSSKKCFARHVRVGIVLDGYVGDVRGRESR